ncbi:unnamed protein product [marine sediment metagenome]|uniref:Uncharacterized protein n=1 Tax=marine sediment metagenome TaxID=412755 RepID=X1L039_9ZZZZ
MKSWQGLSERDRSDRTVSLLVRLLVLITVGWIIAGLILSTL